MRDPHLGVVVSSLHGWNDVVGHSGGGPGSSRWPPLGEATDIGYLLRRNRLFRTRTLPLWVLMKYRRWGPMAVMTPYVFHILDVEFCIAT